MRNRWLIPVLAPVAATIAVVAMMTTPTVAENIVVGTAAPQFTLMDQSGKQVSLSDYAGKIVVLEWFNEGCPFVQRHYKSGDISATAKKYESDGVVWLAINSTHDSSVASNKKAAEAWSMDRPILDDSSGKVGHEYGATNTPEIYIIDKNAQLAYVGAIDNNKDGDKSPSDTINYASKALDELVAGKPVSEPKTKAYGCNVHYAK